MARAFSGQRGVSVIVLTRPREGCHSVRMLDLTCSQCGSDDLERDPTAVPGRGIAVRCKACGDAWRRTPTVSCRRCGSGEVDEVAVDGWAYDDIEEARENPQTTAWSYVDRTLYRCQCRFEWQVAGEQTLPLLTPARLAMNLPQKDDRRLEVRGFNASPL